MICKEVWFSLGLLLAMLVVGAVSSAEDLGVFPAGVLDGGWAASGPVERYDTDTVFNKIDGAADQLLQYGLKQLDWLTIVQKDTKFGLDIELYDMGAAENALGIFAAQRGNEKTVLREGAVYYYTTQPGAIGFIGKTYFKISGAKSNPAIDEKTKQLVKVLSGLKVEKEKASRPYRLLAEYLNIPFEGISFEKADVFQYDFAKAFWFGKPDKEKPLRYYFHEEKSEEAATALYKKLLENNLYDFDSVQQTDTSAVLKHKYLKTLTSLHVQGVLVYGVEGAPDQTALDQHEKELQDALTK
ncbi:MAG TPA: hypothetical protein PLI09_19940 [Candidatus Hydrogenedentes bacterium]|nr:hypothetical protein [Candidatus Hydrogenedentota bacterium]